MNARTPKIIVSTLIGVILVVVSAKPLLIKYYLYKYSRIPAFIQHYIDADSFDLSDSRNNIVHKTDIIQILRRLGYLTSFSIPITKPGANATAIINGISEYADSHAIHLVVGTDDIIFENSLYVIDKPGTQPFWESFVRLYIEANESGQQPVPGYAAQGASTPEP